MFCLVILMFFQYRGLIMSVKTCTIRVQKDATYIYYRSKMLKRIDYEKHSFDTEGSAKEWAKSKGFTHFKLFIVS